MIYIIYLYYSKVNEQEKNNKDKQIKKKKLN